jgi:ribosomal protein S18 acetylase RimI-like enzyme
LNSTIEIVTVDVNNYEKSGFFCYKSKPKLEGCHSKQEWLQQRFADGMRLKLIIENGRSVGFIEYTPGEYAWRAVNAPGYFVIHCLWVVGRSKQKGYGTRLLRECLQDARRLHKQGVVMISSGGNWLADEELFVRHGFKCVDTALPSFRLLVKNIEDGPLPSFPQNWEERLRRYPEGATILYANQCPYMPDAVNGAVKALTARGLDVKTVELTSSADLQKFSPTPYGVFAVIYKGELISYHYLGKRELRQFDEEYSGTTAD